MWSDIWSIQIGLKEMSDNKGTKRIRQGMGGRWRETIWMQGIGRSSRGEEGVKQSAIGKQSAKVEWWLWWEQNEWWMVNHEQKVPTEGSTSIQRSGIIPASVDDIEKHQRYGQLLCALSCVRMFVTSTERVVRFSCCSPRKTNVRRCLWSTDDSNTKHGHPKGSG